MQVEASMLQVLLNIYRDLHVRPGGRLLLVDLHQEWPAEFFRKGDCDEAVELALRQGLLRLISTDEGPALELTGRKLSDASAQAAPRRAMDGVMRHVTLLRRAFTRGPSRWQGPDRRAPTA